MRTVPKKNMDMRLIGVGATIWRSAMGILCGDAMRPWGHSHALAEDSAAPGRTCSFMVAKRVAHMETAVLMGREAGSLLWDVDGYFDTIDVGDLLEVRVPEQVAGLGEGVRPVDDHVGHLHQGTLADL